MLFKTSPPEPLTHLTRQKFLSLQPSWYLSLNYYFPVVVSFIGQRLDDLLYIQNMSCYPINRQIVREIRASYNLHSPLRRAADFVQISSPLRTEVRFFSFSVVPQFVAE